MIYRKISVEKRLPREQNKDYFVFNKDGDMFVEKYQSSDFFKGMNSVDAITHWLEECSLPSDKYIEERFDEDSISGIAPPLKTEGAKWMRDFVLAGTAVVPK